MLDENTFLNALPMILCLSGESGRRLPKSRRRWSRADPLPRSFPESPPPLPLTPVSHGAAREPLRYADQAAHDRR